VFLKLFSFELSHLHSSKLSFSIILPQNELIGNFATEPFNSAYDWKHWFFFHAKEQKIKIYKINVI
ncbi:TPA: hypothetical protein QFL66_002646, partial [Enterococcus faecium]